MSLQGVSVCFWCYSYLNHVCVWHVNPHLSVQVGGAVPVLPEELQATLYRPTSQEWPQGGRDATCTRILRGLDQVMSLAIAEPFIAPVDLNRYPSYALIVEYPIDLSTIKVSAHRNVVLWAGFSSSFSSKRFFTHLMFFPPLEFDVFSPLKPEVYVNII